MSFSLVPQDLGRSESGVIIAGHGKTVSSGITESEKIPLLDLRNPSIAGKGIGLANITYHRIESLPALRMGDIMDLMLGAIEHRPDQLIETRVHSGKDSRSGLFNYIDLS